MHTIREVLRTAVLLALGTVVVLAVLALTAMPLDLLLEGCAR
jgi:hypothetical protein